MIRSTRNPKVQVLKALQSRAKKRREAGVFVIEGVRLAEEALSAAWPVRAAFYTDELSPRGQALVEQLRAGGVPLDLVSTAVMAAASDTQSPQGLILELAEHELPLPQTLDFVLIADQLRDPGNLGTLLRSAAAAAVDAVLLTPGSADAFAPKVLRSGMGAHFKLPIHQITWQEVNTLCQHAGLHLYLAETAQGIPYHQADLTKPLAFILGGEAEGVGEEAGALAHDYIHIPMPGHIESLNAAIAGSLLLFEAVRQRRARSSR